MTMLGREMSNIESREAAARVAQPSGHGPPGPGAGVAGAGQRVLTYRGHVARGFFIVLNVSHIMQYFCTRTNHPSVSIITLLSEESPVSRNNQLSLVIIIRLSYLSQYSSVA